MTPKVVIVCLGLCVGLSLVSSQRFQLTPEASRAVQNLAPDVEKFSLQLFLRTILDGPKENLALSPYSVWAMLTVLAEGARGRTLSEMRLALKHTKSNQEIRQGFKEILKAFFVNTTTVQLETVNSIFCDNRQFINKEYENTIQNTYLTRLFRVNFQDKSTVALINNQIAQATKGKIKEIVNEGDLSNAEMIVTNAVYFKGQWKHPFNASLTKREAFYDEDNKHIGYVNMMTRRAPFPYANMKTFQSHVVELTYGKEGCDNTVDYGSDCSEEDRLSMIVIIPQYGVKLMDIYKKFTEIDVKEIFKKLEDAKNYDDDDVDVYLPRFNVESDFVMNTVLQNMGMYDLFSARYADLSGISSDLYLSRIIHKVQIEVNEEGTVATAVTEGELSNRNTPPKFVANKPFIYLIVEKTTNVIVFSGIYRNPKLE